MIISVHATFGAAIASLIPTHPVEGFVLGFASHFALDLIPHKDYDLISIERDSEGKAKPIDLVIAKFKFVRDVLLVSFDALVGICLAFMFFFEPVHPWIFLIGAIGAILPDFIVFTYLLLEHKTLGHFYDFHSRFDTIINKKLKKKLSQAIGVVLQFCTLVVLIVIMYGLKVLFIS